MVGKPNPYRESPSANLRFGRDPIHLLRLLTKVEATSKEEIKEGDLSQWYFRECRDDLVTYSDKGQKRLPLDFSNSFAMGSGDGVPRQPVKVCVTLHKLLLHDGKLGWHWHKSWNIPNIVITLEVGLFSA